MIPIIRFYINVTFSHSSFFVKENALYTNIRPDKIEFYTMNGKALIGLFDRSMVGTMKYLFRNTNTQMYYNVALRIFNRMHCGAAKSAKVRKYKSIYLVMHTQKRLFLQEK